MRHLNENKKKKKKEVKQDIFCYIVTSLFLF